MRNSRWPGCSLALFISGALTSQVFAQGTTNPSAAGDASSYLPARERDAAGYVTGPARAGWWNDAVFYEVFVRSFADSRGPDRPLANDGIGDFAGLINKLDYLNDGDPKTDSDLGIGGIWLMPIMESPSYHGYDITDYRKVEPDYGTSADFARLVDECHKRGIRVIIDLVMNHCSSKHPAFVAARSDPSAPERAWFIFSDTDPGYRGPWGQQVWHSVAGRGARGADGERGGESGRGGGVGPYYYGLFGSDMPDIDFRSKAASDAMLDVVKFWLAPRDNGGIGIDGFRVDAIRHLIEDGQKQDNTLATHLWLKEFRPYYKSLNPEALCIGEVWSNSDSAASYVGDQLDLCFEFPLAAAMVESAKSGDAKHVRAAQELVLKAYPPNQYGTFLTNHDQPRVMSQLKNDPGAARVAAAMLLLGPGVPFIYYGEEVGMIGDKPDPDIRTPMQWSTDENAGFCAPGVKPWRAVNKGFGDSNIATEREDESSMLSAYRKLLRVRAGSRALSSGTFTPIEAGNPGVYAFLREGPASETGPGSAVVVINLSRKPVSEYALSCLKSELREGVVMAEAMHGAPTIAPKTDEKGGFSAYRPIGTLAPREVYVIQAISARR